MIKTSSAKPIPFISIIIAIVLCLATALSATDVYLDEEEDEGLGIAQEVPQDALEEAEVIVEGFLSPTQQDIKTAEAIRERTDRITAEALGVGAPPTPTVEHTPSSSLCASKVYYLISLSMPSDTVSNVVSDALRINDACGKKVAIVGIRGFVKGNMKTTLRDLHKIMLGLKRNLPVSILAKEFKAYGVKEVPFIIVRNKDGEKTVMGDMSIQYAVERAHHGEIAGETYDLIIENDFYDMMAQAAAKAEARLRQKQLSYDFDFNRYDGHFKKADKDNVFHIDPTYIADTDIKDAAGNMIIKKGTIIRPSDYAPLGRYVFVNGNDEKEVNYAISLHPKQIIIVSGNPVTLSKKYKMPFYVVDDSLVYGLSLSKTPSIIEQDGRLIRVTEKKL